MTPLQPGDRHGEPNEPHRERPVGPSAQSAAGSCPMSAQFVSFCAAAANQLAGPQRVETAYEGLFIIIY